jgi:hypothetical protein
MLVVPSQTVLATGTDDPYADLVVQRRFATRNDDHQGFAATDGDQWDAIDGEVVSLAETSLLPTIDRYEGFAPGGPSLYVRVLVPAWGPSTSPAWTYASAAGLPASARRIGNCWLEQ